MFRLLLVALSVLSLVGCFDFNINAPVEVPNQTKQIELDYVGDTYHASDVNSYGFWGWSEHGLHLYRWDFEGNINTELIRDKLGKNQWEDDRTYIEFLADDAMFYRVTWYPIPDKVFPLKTDLYRIDMQDGKPISDPYLLERSKGNYGRFTSIEFMIDDHHEMLPHAATDGQYTVNLHGREIRILEDTTITYNIIELDVPRIVGYANGMFWFTDATRGNQHKIMGYKIK